MNELKQSEILQVNGGLSKESAFLFFILGGGYFIGLTVHGVGNLIADQFCNKENDRDSSCYLTNFVRYPLEIVSYMVINAIIISLSP